ncbi:MAG TPA: DUF4037 domain-containing protein [Microlunatus sp.]
MIDRAAGFVPGHQLSKALYADQVGPALAREFPRLRYAAGLVGRGSDVLGYDSERSTDHDWGPRLQIVLPEADRAGLADPILRTVDAALPDTVCGVPVELPGATNLPGDEVTNYNSQSPRNHGVTVTSVERLMQELLDTAIAPDRWTSARWLATPRQSLLEFTAGPLHRDDSGELTAARSTLARYPQDVWLYVMSGRWQRIAQLESFVGRTFEVGDEIGSRVLIAQIVRDAMQLALLQQRAYTPYPKWLGTAFERAEGDPELPRLLSSALSADNSAERQQFLIAALLELSRRHDRLQLTDPIRSRTESFFGRPFPVIWCERIARALHSAIDDPEVATLTFGLGGIDEISDSTNALGSGALRTKIISGYRPGAV